MPAGAICRSLSISEQSYYRWQREYGGLKLDQAKRLKILERENGRLRKAVSDLTLDRLMFSLTKVGGLEILVRAVAKQPPAMTMSRSAAIVTNRAICFSMRPIVRGSFG